MDTSNFVYCAFRSNARRVKSTRVLLIRVQSILCSLFGIWRGNANCDLQYCTLNKAQHNIYFLVFRTRTSRTCSQQTSRSVTSSANVSFRVLRSTSLARCTTTTPAPSAKATRTRSASITASIPLHSPNDRQVLVSPLLVYSVPMVYLSSIYDPYIITTLCERTTMRATATETSTRTTRQTTTSRRIRRPRTLILAADRSIDLMMCVSRPCAANADAEPRSLALTLGCPQPFSFVRCSAPSFLHYSSFWSLIFALQC